MRKVIFLLFILCCFSAFSQEKTIVKGQLIFSSVNMSEINIINTSTNDGTINDINGGFSIEVAVGDRLLFSSVQYEPKWIEITPEIFERRWFQVKLVPAINELEAVSISNIDLSGNMFADAAGVETKPYFNNQSFGLPMPGPEISVEDRRIMTASTGGPVGLLANIISGRLKQLKRLKNYAELDQLVSKGMNSMEIDFFVEQCGIPKKYIASFIYFCAEDPTFSSLLGKGREFDLVRFFKNKASEFKEKKGWVNGKPFYTEP